MTDFTELSIGPNLADESQKNVTGMMSIMPDRALAGVKEAQFLPTFTTVTPTSSSEITSDINLMSRLERLQASELRNHDDTLVRAARPRQGASGRKIQSSYPE
ncbi:hypothetical protein T484DRAFT_1750223 [Baffinella frigidus]|nr:hypothetical protein T484DRAFT_1750223 [Cryptophyta sp. CCMP2293]